MNFDRKLKEIEHRIASIDQEVRTVKEAQRHAAQFTEKLLHECAKEGLTKVSVCKRHDSIKQSVGYPFTTEGSVFAIGPQRTGGGLDSTGWPAIWGIVERLGIRAGASNGMQTQANTSGLIDGVYHLRAGVWKRVDEEATA